MIKRKLRKNPKYNDEKYFNLLYKALFQLDPEFLSDAIVYYNIGEECKDCNNDYLHCKCEYCDDCGFNVCLCKYSLHISMVSPYVDRKDEIKTEKVTWDIASKTLTEEQFKKLERKVILRKNPRKRNLYMESSTKNNSNN